MLRDFDEECFAVQPFLPRDAMYSAWPMPSCGVRPSVTLLYCIETERPQTYSTVSYL